MVLSLWFTVSFCCILISIFYLSGASNLEELQQKLSSTLMIRREKNEVLTQLPPKQRQRVLFELKDSDIKKVSY